MNHPHILPSYAREVAVDAVWHTNLGFVIKPDDGHSYHLDTARLSTSAAQYLRDHVVGSVEMHRDPFDKQGTPSSLLPKRVAYLHACIVETLDAIPLDPTEAISVVERLWLRRIEQATRPDERAKMRDRLASLKRDFESVIDGTSRDLLSLPGILGICREIKDNSDHNVRE